MWVREYFGNCWRGQDTLGTMVLSTVRRQGSIPADEPACSLRPIAQVRGFLHLPAEMSPGIDGARGSSPGTTGTIG
jgi:hypothetical protein